MQGNSSKSDWHKPETIISMIQVSMTIIAFLCTLLVFFILDKKQKELSLISSELQILKNEAELRLSELEFQKKTIEVDDISTAKIEVTQNITQIYLGEVSDGLGRYYVKYEYVITNMGMKECEITKAKVNLFLSNFSVNEIDNNFVINDYDDRHMWSRIKTVAYYYATKWKSSTFYVLDGKDTIRYKKGGGGTSRNDFGETSDGSMEVVILAKKCQMIGFQLKLILNDGKSDKDKWRYSKNIILR